MRYTKFSELDNHIVELNDEFVLAGIKYSVRHSFLRVEEHVGIHGNAYIFRVLGIEDKEKFCEECYGYEPYGGGFPNSYPDDFEALTKVAKALMQLVESRK